jgi:hypothetical protein
LVRSWGIFVALAAAASLVTPHGITLWLFPFHLTNTSFALGFVTEWQRPDLSRLQPVELWLGGLVLFIALNRVRLSLVQWLLVLGFAVMALTRERHAELLALVVPLVIANSVGESPAASAKIASRPRRYVLLAAAVVAAGFTGAAAYTGAPEDNAAIAPRAAVAEVTRRGITGPVFNDYNFGGYLIFRGIPVFVDGRIDLYGDAFMRDYARALNGDAETLAALLARYHVTWTLLESSSPASTVLDHLPGWQLIYADRTTKVHVLAP